MKDSLKVTGDVKIRLNGEVVRHIPNTVVDAGKAWMTDRLDGSPESVMAAIAIGTNNTAVGASDVALNTEIARVTLDATTVTANTIEYTATFPAGTGTGAIVEAGILNIDDSTTLHVHDGADNAAVLTDSTASFTNDALIGATLYNLTDGSDTVVTDNGATTITGVLANGTDDDWDIGDSYSLGKMLARTVFGAINKDASDSLSITWQVTIN